MEQMTQFEKLAALTAIDKALKPQIKAVRAECDAYLKDAYESMGVERMALKVGGQKAGDFLIAFTADGFDVTDKAAFEEFALDYGLATVRRKIRPEMMASAVRALEDYFEPEVLDEVFEDEVVLCSDWEKAIYNVNGTPVYEDSGLVVPGLSPRPREIKNTQVRGCKPEDTLPKVAARMGGEFNAGFTALLLEGGDAA